MITILAVIAAVCGAGAAGLSSAGQDHAVTYMLAMLQTALVAWLAAIGWSSERTWARAGVIVAAAWIPTFLISSWVYAVNPSLLDIGPPNRALATVDLSLVCFIAGYAGLLRGAGGRGEQPVRGATPPYIQMREVRLSRRWVISPA